MGIAGPDDGGASTKSNDARGIIARMNKLNDLTTEVRFRERMRGYDYEEVDNYVKTVSRVAAQARDQIAELQQRLTHVESYAGNDDGVDEMRETLLRTLVMAQRTADAAVSEARSEAKSITESAQERAAKTVAEADATASVRLRSSEERAAKTVADAEAAANARLRSSEERAAEILAEAEESCNLILSEAKRTAAAELAADRARAREEIETLEATKVDLEGAVVSIGARLQDERAQLRSLSASFQSFVEQFEPELDASTPEQAGAAEAQLIGVPASDESDVETDEATDLADGDSADTRADLAAQDSADTRADDAAQDSADTRADLAAQDSADTRADDAAQDSADTRADDAAQDSADTRADLAAQDSADTRADDAAQDSADTRADNAAQDSADTRADNAAQDSADTRADNAAQDSADTRADNAAQDSADTRADNAAQDSAAAEASVEEDDPESAAAADPEPAQESVLEFPPGTDDAPQAAEEAFEYTLAADTLAADTVPDLPVVEWDDSTDDGPFDDDDAQEAPETASGADFAPDGNGSSHPEFVDPTNGGAAASAAAPTMPSGGSDSPELFDVDAEEDDEFIEQLRRVVSGDAPLPDTDAAMAAFFDHDEDAGRSSGALGRGGRLGPRA